MCETDSHTSYWPILYLACLLHISPWIASMTCKQVWQDWVPASSQKHELTGCVIRSNRNFSSLSGEAKASVYASTGQLIRFTPITSSIEGARLCTHPAQLSSNFIDMVNMFVASDSNTLRWHSEVVPGSSCSNSLGTAGLQ